MAIKVATLAVDVTVKGVAAAVAGLTTLNQKVSNVRKSVLGTTQGLLKLWAAYQIVTSASSIASAVMSVFSNALGYLINVILLPFLPLLISIGLELYKFGAWFSDQGPTVRAAILLLGGALLIAFGGPTAIAIGVILVLLGLMYAWSNTKAAAITGAILVLAGAIVGLAVAFGILDAAAAPWIAAALIIVGIILLLRSAWLALTGQGSFEWPNMDSIKRSVGLDGSSGPVVPAGGGYGGGTTNNNTQNWNVNIAGVGGGTGGGRDAAIAFGSHASARERMF